MKYLSLMLFGAALFIAACSDTNTLRSDHPILSVQDLEEYLVGDLEASFVGTDNCLAACHKHDQIQKDFQHSVHSAQVDVETGLPLVNCESCHGAGSKAIENCDETGQCDTHSFLTINEFPAQAQALICLKCHSVASTPNLQYWNASVHANSDVSCIDCHNLHEGPQQKVSREEMADMCFSCHQDVKMAFNQFSHHPVQEGKIVCTDCHNPHGTTQDKLLKGNTVKENCTRCHMEQQGPFVYEHADVTEDCRSCHQPHGSPNDPLLTVSQPFLCLQCHPGHQSNVVPSMVDANFKAGFYTRCTDCHSQIHGTDVPSSKGRGTFLAR